MKREKKITWQEQVDNEHLDSVWYGGRIATIETERYKIYIEACGDVSGTINGEHYKDKNNTGYFGQCLKENKIKNDKELKKAESEGIVTFWDNNWFEFQIWDTIKKDWIDNFIDNVIDINPNDDFDWLDDWLDEYEGEE